MKMAGHIVPVMQAGALAVALSMPLLCGASESMDRLSPQVDLGRLLINALAITLIVVVVIFIFALRDKDE